MRNGEEIGVKIGADSQGLEPGLAGASRAVGKHTERMRDDLGRFTKSAKEAEAGVSKAMSDLSSRITGLLGSVAVVAGAVQLAKLSDDAQLAAARLRGLIGNTEAAAAAQTQLYNLSQRLQASYMEVVGSFSRILPAVQALGGGVNEATKLSEILLSTARLSGSSTAEASASAMQFAQALGSGTLQGDELRSILENNNTLARELAGSLGVTIGELRKLGSEGKLTSDLVANALLGRYDDIKARTAELPPTIGGAWTQIENAFTRFIEKFESGTGVFAFVGALLSEVAKVIEIVTSRLAMAGGESDRLGRNGGVQAFGRMAGLALAYLADAIDACITQFVTVGETIGAVVAATVQLGSGNVRGAFAILEEQGDRVASAAKRIAAAYTGAGQAVQAYLAVADSAGDYSNEGRNAAGPTKGNLKGKAKPKDEQVKPGAKAEASAMGEYQGRLDALRLFYAQQSAAQGTQQSVTLAAEYEFWTKILANETVTAKDRETIQRRMLAIRLSDLEAANASMLQAQSIYGSMRQQSDLAAIERERSDAQARLAAGTITQEQYLEQLRSFEDRKLEIQTQAIMARVQQIDALDPDSPAKKAQLYEQLLQLRLQYEQRVQQIGQQSAEVQRTQQQAVYDSIQGGLTPILQQLLSFQTSVAGVFQGLARSVLSTMSQMLSQWIAKKVAAYAAEKALSMGLIAAKAGEAGAGAAASQASIPVVGPGLAIAAMGSVFTAVMGLAKSSGSVSVPSAARGFDIPSGLNPLTQLHEREMVLPQEQADAVRDMASGGRREVILKATPMRGNFFLMHRDDLREAFREMNRDGSLAY